MTTYASPRLTRLSLQILISIIFLFGCFMVIVSVIQTISYVGRQKYSMINQTIVNNNNNDKNNIDHHINDGDDDDDDPGGNQTIRNDKNKLIIKNSILYETYDDNIDRFPSITSPTVQILLALLTFLNGIFGIVSITKQKSSLLSTYSYMLLIIFIIKLLFIIASLAMFTVENDQNFLSIIAILIIITMIVEIILVMIVYQFKRLVKRGDAARQEIQSIHSYHRERRSRSRSQSHVRSIHGNSDIYNYSIDKYSNIGNHSRTPSKNRITPEFTRRAISIEPISLSSSSIIEATVNNNNYDESIANSDYVPPPIYLKLDR